MYLLTYHETCPINFEDVHSLYHYARKLITENNFSLALAVLKEIITDYQGSNYAYRALNLSIRLCDKLEVVNTSEWLTTLSNEVSNDDLSEIIDLKKVSNYHKNKKIGEAIALSESISGKGNTKHEVSVLFNLFNFYQKDKGDIDEAEKYFEKLKEKYPDHELTLIASSDMNDDNYDKSLAKSIAGNDDMTEEVVLPENYKIHSAYPNPFNPSTTLEYELPVSANVECSIFDLRGNLVKNYKYNKQAGAHRIIWNGSNIPSGIYLIRFVAEASDGSETFLDYQKVTLLK
jgi:tetratricopeptide (TPR) repeat protein